MRIETRTLLVAFVMLSAVAFSGCTQNEQPKDSAGQLKGSQQKRSELPADFEVSRVWEYPGGEAPVTRMNFERNGQLLFEGGFLFWNPSQWSFNRDTHELTLKIPKIDDESLWIQESHSKRGPGIRVDREARTIIIEIDETTDRFNFQGWMFFRMDEKNT